MKDSALWSSLKSKQFMKVAGRGGGVRSMPFGGEILKRENALLVDMDWVCENLKFIGRSRSLFPIRVRESEFVNTKRTMYRSKVN